MLIDVEPLIPLLDKARQAQHELLASDVEWHALDKAQQLAQVDAFTARDEVARKAYEDACRQVTAALTEAVLRHGTDE